MTVYADSPAETAVHFRREGCEWVHLVDLQGARAGRPENLATVREILKKSGLKAEVGGGIRTETSVREVLEAGADRVILGTAALRNPEFLQKMLERYGERIAVGVDCRDGRVSVQGWTETSTVRCEDFCESWKNGSADGYLHGYLTGRGPGRGQHGTVCRAEPEIFPPCYCFRRCFRAGGPSKTQTPWPLRSHSRQSVLYRKHFDS